MNKLIYKANYPIMLLVMALIILAQYGCKKGETFSTNAPVITKVRSYAASPGDSVLTKVGTDQWVVLIGENLRGVTGIYFDGVAATFNPALFSDTSAVVLIPAVIPFPSVSASDLNTIRYVTTHGETTFSFPIVAPAPTITSISNECAKPGDSVTINGTNFFLISNVVYGGAQITGYTASGDGTTIKLMVPSTLTTSGIVSVTTISGTASTAYKVNDFVTGVLNNYDAINNYSWGSSVSSSSTAYPNNTGNYGIMSATSVSANNTAWYNSGRSINLNAAQWVPAANLADSVSHYAVKFEISVTKATPWTNGTIYILKDYSWTYLAIYRPWKSSTGVTSSFSTNGWQTVTIPLSEFRTSTGTGTSATSLTTLLGSTGKGALNIYFINDQTSSVSAFAAGIDNIRVVKIK